MTTASLNRLIGYCNQFLVSHSDIFFKSNNLASLPKETLIALLKSDDLNMDEDDIWSNGLLSKFLELQMIQKKFGHLMTLTC